MVLELGAIYSCPWPGRDRERGGERERETFVFHELLPLECWTKPSQPTGSGQEGGGGGGRKNYLSCAKSNFAFKPELTFAWVPARTHAVR